MKLSNQKLQTTLRIALCIMAIALVSSCSPKKAEPMLTNQNSNSILITANKALAYCNRTNDTNFNFNTAVAKNSSGQYVSDMIKLKMNFISATATASGNTIQFFKWRVNGSTADLDSNALSFYVYNYSNGQATSGAIKSLAASQINQTTGLYIQLNDPSESYQVIKAVVYNAEGAVVAQVNTLIPAFYASPEDYKLNADGSPRAQNLQQLHPLFGGTATDAEQTLAKHCF